MLRNIVVLVLFTGSLNSLKGQLFKKDYLYADLAVGLGNFKGVNANLVYSPGGSYFLEFHYGISVGETANPPPSNLIPPSTTATVHGHSAFDRLDIFQIGIGKTIKNFSKARLNLLLRLGWARYHTPANWGAEYHTSFFSGGYYYDFDYPEINTMAVTIYPKVEIPFGRVYGMSFGTKFLATGQVVSIQLVWSQMIGIVRPKKSKPE